VLFRSSDVLSDEGASSCLFSIQFSPNMWWVHYQGHPPQ
jgi:hypothetical protein